MSEEKIYWLDKFEGKAAGGIFWRGVDLVEFIQKVEQQKGRVAALKFDDSYNVEFIVEVKGDKNVKGQ